MRAELFFWRPVLSGLLSFSEVEKISFIDLVHAHEVLDFKEMRKGSILETIGETLGEIGK